ncbi:MAG: helix-turn-helix transcriptional regulator [Chromatiales bacterium]|nr:helix-turn-helix transcriptional regulator [Chromatiales bacterium]
MKNSDAAIALSALAHDKRLEIFRLLVKRGPEGYAAGVIAGKLGIPAPTLSFHIKELDRAGLVGARQDGRFIHYSANFVAMRKLVDFLTDHCCSLADESCTTDCLPAAQPARRKRA